MYLKSVDLIGFKSFAEKTRLNFEPGLTAIVGPNGCGKSNVSDAVRWVLGEQRARAVRGTAMTDVIFNGTDTHRALNMAEVSLTLADCRERLGTDYDEVCITRRVFRSGESGYFINKKPCRLKDIQRLFMDTGIGTDSYSIMEQGKIDQILSSRPQDRRDVFEEASGITKYKADKKEALRKLEHTEANLLRLADVIREVKRQIISLQRQAAKAQRYKALQEEVRGLDIFVTRRQLKTLTAELEEADRVIAGLETETAELHQRLETAETEAETVRTGLSEIDQAIAAAMDRALEAKSELERAGQTARVNADRIEELQTLAARDSNETEEARRRMAEHQAACDALTARAETAAQEQERYAAELAESTRHQKELEGQVATARDRLGRLRTETLDLESRSARLQNELHELEAKERAAVVRKERLAAESADLDRVLSGLIGRQEEMAGQVEAQRGTVTRKTEFIEALQSEQVERARAVALREKGLFEQQKERAGLQAQLEMLSSEAARQEGLPPGACALLDPDRAVLPERDAVVGLLAEQVAARNGWQTALEAVLRPWMDAVVVRSRQDARGVIELLASGRHGSVRLLSVEGSVPAPAAAIGIPGRPLLDCVECSAAVRPLAQRLLHQVFATESQVDLPREIPAGFMVVTRDGRLFTGQGAAELWMPEAGAVNPLSRHHLREQLQEKLESLDRVIEEQTAALETLCAEKDKTGAALESAVGELQQLRHGLSLLEGEQQALDRQVAEARKRVETVRFEVEALSGQNRSGDEKRQQLAGQIQQTRERQQAAREESAALTQSLNKLEAERSEAVDRTGERRIAWSERTQAVQSLTIQRDQLRSRIGELEELVRDRSHGLADYTRRIEQLKEAVAVAEAGLPGLQRQAEQCSAELEAQKGRREVEMNRLRGLEETLRETHRLLEEKQEVRSRHEIRRTEQRIRCENSYDRITSTYHVTREQIFDEPEPDWGEAGQPPAQELETRVAEMIARLESMGPVNLVAIEEHAELEERFAFLNQQQNDLIEAKEQLLEMIRTINLTTTEMFTDTFNKVNANFQGMFEKMFGGGTAKLVLVDEEDVLESGIEIIARPPGKKLQSISLLSGGERTMTAVALLFSLYMVKPSPFCVLDELDAPLDEANIGRFVQALEGFLEKSQFIVITHSKKTIAAASVIYGVTMPRKGVSTVVSMKFSDYEQADAARAGG